MSIRTLIQICISLLIFFIISWVYLEYFNTEKKIIEEINSSDSNISKLEKKILDLEKKNENLESMLKNVKDESDKKINQINTEKIIENTFSEVKKEKSNNNVINKNEINNKEISKNKTNQIKDLIKDVEYSSIDQKGNRFHLLATSGKSNINNNDILDLDNVRGKITSDIRDTIYIVSDYAQYNSTNLNSKFYENVIINYENKQITCKNFDINMETNKAIAYNNVIVTDPKSVMKAGIVEFDLNTKNVVINPESSLDEVEVITN